MDTTWTQDRIIGLLERSDLAVERAIVALYDRQTQDEKVDSTTKHDNARGFRKNHDHTGSFFARIILKGWKQDGNKNRVHLNPYKLAKARGIVLHYSRQLAEAANTKQGITVPSPKRRPRSTKATTSPTPVSDREPPVGSWASVARMMASGDDSGFDWDAWRKDQMKETNVGFATSAVHRSRAARVASSRCRARDPSTLSSRGPRRTSTRQLARCGR